MDTSSPLFMNNAYFSTVLQWETTDTLMQANNIAPYGQAKVPCTHVKGFEHMKAQQSQDPGHRPRTALTVIHAEHYAYI